MIKHFLQSFILICLVFTFTEIVAAQEIQGTVTEEDGTPLPGVNIVVQGTTIGTTTNADGQFELNVPSLDETLVVSSLGYETQNVSIDGRSELDISMTFVALDVGEVVVGAYAPQRARDVTGSISRVDFEREGRTPLATQRVDQMLQGRAPGVNVRTVDGAPGGEVIIRIRGMESIQGGNQALIVVDGLQGADLRSLNPRDISNVEILKDASATAMYGSEGASGVVLVTTKQGELGKPMFDYSYEGGTQRMINNVELMSPGDWARNQNQIHMADNLDRDPEPYFSESEIAAFERGEGITDWIDEVFDPAYTQNHQLSVSGATEDINYRVSGSFMDQEGVLLNSAYNRFSLRTNLNAEITDWARASVSWAGSRENESSPLIGGVDWPINPVGAAYSLPPVMPVYDEDGNYVERGPTDIPRGPVTTWNAVASAVEPDIGSESNRNNVNARVDFTLMEGLSLQVSGGAIITDNERRRFYNSNTETGNRHNGEATVNNNESRRFQSSNILTYQREIDRHNITLTAVAEQKWDDNYWSNIRNRDFQNHDTGFFNLGGSAIQESSSGESQRVIRSGLGRFAYEYDDRYLVTGSMRTDGSSVFGADNKWASFPSATVGWRLSEEPYLGMGEIFENFLLRGSWGRTGNQAISPYQSLARIAQQGNYPYNGTGLQTGFSIVSSANPSLKWETTEQTNVGVDVELIGGRFHTAVDYYVKKTNDLLMNRQIPTHTGLGTILDNVGSVENRGFELQVGGRGQTQRFSWGSTVNFTLNRNKVLDLGENDQIYFEATGGGHQVNPSDPFMRLREGEPFGQMFGWKVLGTWNTDQAEEAAKYGQLPGDIRYHDINGDYMIDLEDEQLIGNTLPNYFIGFNNNLGYRNFELNFLVEGQFGHDIMNIAKVKRLHDDQTGAELNNRWTPDNQDTKIRGIIDARTRADANLTSQINLPGSATSLTDKFVEDASYVRLKSLSLGYNVPVELAQRFGLRNLRVHFTGTNLITFTDYTGWDPEVSSFTGNDAQFGTDFHSYPNSRVYSLGVNVSF